MTLIGRALELARLDGELRAARSSRGRMVLLLGRRQVGKSTLADRWVATSGRASLYYQARGLPPPAELEAFNTEFVDSDLGRSARATRSRWSNWDQAFAAVAAAAAQLDEPPVVVLDEVPLLAERDDTFESVLQANWDRRLAAAGLVLVLIGSNVAVMDALTAYDRPLYGRVDRQLRLEPLPLSEVAGALDVEPRAAVDSYLVTGGFPRVLLERLEHPTLDAFLEASFDDETSPLLFAGQRVVDAEFPLRFAARSVLRAVGADERAFGAIQHRAGVSERGLSSALDELVAHRVVSRDDPLSVRRVTNRRRYRVSDPYLRFWLRFVDGRLGEVAGGRGAAVLADLRRGWSSWAGRAVEPVVRDAIATLLPADTFGDARVVGSWWTRDHRVEVDLVGADRGDLPTTVEFVGSVKWRASAPVDLDDLAALDRGASEVPGVDETTPRVLVTATDATADVRRHAKVLTPADLIEV